MRPWYGWLPNYKTPALWVTILRDWERAIIDRNLSRLQTASKPVVRDRISQVSAERKSRIFGKYRKSGLWGAITLIRRRENTAEPRTILNWMHLSMHVSHDRKWCALKCQMIDSSNGQAGHSRCLFKSAIQSYAWAT